MKIVALLRTMIVVFLLLTAFAVISLSVSLPEGYTRLVVMVALFMLTGTFFLTVIFNKIKPLSPIGQLIQLGQLARDAGKTSEDPPAAVYQAVVTKANADEDKLIEILNSIAVGNFQVEFNSMADKSQKAVGAALANLEEVRTQITAFTDRTANGDLDTIIDATNFKGDWATIANNLNDTIHSLNQPFVAIKKVMDAIQEGDFRYRTDGSQFGSFSILADSINDAMENTSSYVEEIDRILDAIAEGNLKGKIERRYVGTFDLIKTSVNSILVRLNETIEDIDKVSESVSNGAMQLSQSSSELSAGVVQQMASVEELASEIAVVDSQSSENATNSKKALELSNISRRSAETSNEEMKLLLESMEKINDSSDKISHIIKTIEDIAFQTNLLALNAAVEASRAGEHGRGFAVVADQVRALANRSSEAAKETSTLIKKSSVSVEEGMKRANDTATSLEKIVQNVVDVADVVGEISKSSKQQREAIGSINDGLNQINAFIQKDAATSEETSAAAADLDSQVITLQQKLSYFQTRASDMSKIRKAWTGATFSTSGLEKFKNISGAKLEFESGDIIVHEGDDASESMFFLLEGHAEVYKNYESAGQLMIATLGPGDPFGEMSLFLQQPRTATVVAREKVSLFEIKERNIYEFMSNYPDIAYSITTSLCTRLSVVMEDFG